MEAHFKIDGCHSLRISTDVPRLSGDVAAVGIQLEYEPIRMPGDPPHVPRRACSSTDLNTPDGVEILMSKRLRASEARAIASMLLSAATESYRS